MFVRIAFRITNLVLFYMESKTYKTGVDKDLDQRFDEIGKLISAYRSSDFSKEELENQGNRAIKIVDGLTSIMKYEPLTPESQLNERICNVVETSIKTNAVCPYGILVVLMEISIMNL